MSHSGECGCRSACTLEVTIEPGDRAFIAASRTDHSVMSAALRSVLDLHHVFSVGGKPAPLPELMCDHCGVPFPCPTVVAVTAEVERAQA